LSTCCRILPQLGIGVTVRFPQPAEAAAIAPAGADVTGAAFQAEQRAALTNAGSRPVLHIPVYYRENGSFLVNEVTDAQWQALTGLPWGALRFDEATLADLQRLGVREIRLSADERGLYLDFDGKPLPYLTWNRGEIAQTLALVENLGLLGALTGDDDRQPRLTCWRPGCRCCKPQISRFRSICRNKTCLSAQPSPSAARSCDSCSSQWA
jgi:hypothetical protein